MKTCKVITDKNWNDLTSFLRIILFYFLLFVTDRKSEPLLRPDAKDHSKVDSSKAGSSQQQKKAPQTVKTMKASVNSVSTGVLGIIHILRNHFLGWGSKEVQMGPKKVQNSSKKGPIKSQKCRKRSKKVKNIKNCP